MSQSTVSPHITLSRRKILATFASGAALIVIGGCSTPSGRGTSVVYGSLTEPSNLNPLLAPDIPSRQALDLVCDGLVTADETSTIQPRLAEKWETSSDGRIWTFNLRPELKFSDGSALTSDDVKFTYETLLDPRSGATLPRGDYSALEAVEAPDPRTVRFILKKPYAPILSRLSVGIVPSAALKGKPLAGADISRMPIGAGPYRLSEWASGQRLVFQANPYYWGSKPAIATIIWKVVPDSASLTMQLLSGDVGIALVADPNDRAGIRRDSRFSVAESPGGATQISLQLKDPLFSDVRVRRGLALALDVTALIVGAMKGEAKPSVSDIPPTSWASDSAVQPLKKDLDAAARFLSEAGYVRSAGGTWEKAGIPLKFSMLTYAGDRVREATLLTVQQQWKDFGVQVDVGTQERNSFVANRVLKGDFQAVLLESAVQVDPDLSRRFHSASIKAGQNFLNYANPKLDALLDQANATSDREARRPLYLTAQQTLLEDLPQIPLFHATQMYAAPKTLQGLRPNALGPFWNVADWKI